MLLKVLMLWPSMWRPFCTQSSTGHCCECLIAQPDACLFSKAPCKTCISDARGAAHLVSSDFSRESSVNRVVLEHVGHILAIDERVVDSNNLDVITFHSRSRHQAADSAEPYAAYVPQIGCKQLCIATGFGLTIDTDFDLFLAARRCGLRWLVNSNSVNAGVCSDV